MVSSLKYFTPRWCEYVKLDDSRYPEIQELYMYQLARAVRSSDSPDIAAAFDTKIQEYFAGKLPHAKDLVLTTECHHIHLHFNILCGGFNGAASTLLLQLRHVSTD